MINDSAMEKQDKLHDKDDKDEEVELNYISPEGFTKTKILELKDVSFSNNEICEYFKKLDEVSYYSKRQLIDNILKVGNSANQYLEKLLEHEDTYNKLQSLYLDELVKIINNSNNNKIEAQIIEKIQKSSIILSKVEYESKIKNLKLESIENIKYNDYKHNIILMLNFISKIKYEKTNEKNIIIAKNTLNVKKKFVFSREPEFGNNNYYFYKLALLFYDSMYKLFYNLDEFDYYFIIDEIINILNEANDNNSFIQKKFQFRYLINILLDKDLIINDFQYQNAKNFIKSNDIDFSQLEKKINEIKKNQLNYFRGNTIKYDINFNKESNKIEYIINDNTKIGKKNNSRKYKMDFDLHKFNNRIVEILNDNLPDFEYDILKAPKFDEEYCSEYYIPYRQSFNKIITKILKSNAAISFFQDKYQSKYSNLIYHFNDDKLIKEILNKISFAPIYSEKINGYTDLVDLSITINSIPSKYGGKSVNIYHRKILQLGKIVLTAMQAIFGQYFRRYYSYLTRGIIPFDTKDDKIINFGEEGGFYIEKKFLGLNPAKSSTLSISQALSLLYWDKFDKYPMIKKNSSFIVNEDILKNLIINNEEVFDFIGTQPNQVDFKDYLTYLVPVDSYWVKRKCFLDEDYIILKEDYLG